MKDRVLSFLHLIGLPQVLRLVFRRKLLVLAYHAFRQEIESGYLLPFMGTYLTAAKFEEQLRYLKRYYVPVPLAAALDALDGGKPLPDRAVVLTIDDGYASVYRIAFPLLRRYWMPATVFLATGFIDGESPLWVDRLVYAVVGTRRETFEFHLGGQALQYDLRMPVGRRTCIQDLNARLKAVEQGTRDDLLARIEARLNSRLEVRPSMPDAMQPLSWAQVREMRKSGLITFGSHTHRHWILSRCPEESCRREIRHSKERLEAELGEPCRWFAYPNGGLGDYNAATGRILSEEGFQCGLVSVPGLVSAGDDRLTLRRVPILNWMDLKALALQITLVIPALRKLKDSFRKG